MLTKDSGPLDQKLEKLVQETLELWHIPGVSVAVVDEDQTHSNALPFLFSQPLTHTLRATAQQHSPSPP